MEQFITFLSVSYRTPDGNTALFEIDAHSGELIEGRIYSHSKLYIDISKESLKMEGKFDVKSCHSTIWIAGTVN